ncbi:hypothetical protein LTR96_004061 [Exophiala xenobiotica]|nr:hypothetical protein LTR92_003982 [Exophiala xenobiotica]KAK5270783.1 hypothetical protein LTR96_004061 [Exophiala xenobiotica]KAK5339673.1 hypothetical protein LTR98_004475 [Exophiala xenobiotica]
MPRSESTSIAAMQGSVRGSHVGLFSDQSILNDAQGKCMSRTDAPMDSTFARHLDRSSVSGNETSRDALDRYFESLTSTGCGTGHQGLKDSVAAHTAKAKGVIDEVQARMAQGKP